VRPNAAMEGKDWLLGERSVADSYLYALSRWLKMTPKPVESYPAIARHYARMASDPSVRRALAAEGLNA
jgi:glutathione S-transferase